MVNKLHVLLFEYAQCAYFIIFSWTFTWHSTIGVKFRELYRPRYNWPYAENTQLICTSWPTSWFDWSGRSWWTRPICTGEFHQSWSLIRPQAPNPLIDNALMYIAGWAVCKVMPTLACKFCRESLVTEILPSQYTSSCHLLWLKQNGGLIVPSVPMHTDYSYHRTTDSSFVQCWLHRTSHDFSQSANKCPGRARK